MSGKLNIDNRVSIPIVVDDALDNIDGIVSDYNDVDISYGIDTVVSMHGLVPRWIHDNSKYPYKATWTIGPSRYTPHGWQIPLLFAIAESTGEYTFVCNPRDTIDAALISKMMYMKGDSTVVCLCDYDYNEAMRNSVISGNPMKWLNTPILFRKDVFYRNMSYFVGQIYYYRYMQVRLWIEGDFVCMPMDKEYLPIEDIHHNDIYDYMVNDGYRREDIMPGGKYFFELGKYDMEDTSKSLCDRCGIEYKGILPFLNEINYE